MHLFFGQVFEIIQNNGIAVGLIAVLLFVAKPIVGAINAGIKKGLRVDLERVGEAASSSILTKTLASFFGRTRHSQLIISYFNEIVTDGLRTQNPFVIPLDDVFIGLKLSSKSPSLVSDNMIEYGGGSFPKSIWGHLVPSTEETSKRLAIVGPAGCGKTTILNHVAFSICKNTYAQKISSSGSISLKQVVKGKLDALKLFFLSLNPLNAASSYLLFLLFSGFVSKKNELAILSSFVERKFRKVPIVINLRKAAQEGALTENRLLASFMKSVGMEGDVLYETWLKNALSKGKCFVMLDGFDEVPAESGKRKAESGKRKAESGKRKAETRSAFCSKGS